jgi:hypothetical protein
VKRYQRSGMIEPLRQLCRAMDLISLLIVFGLKKHLPPLHKLRRFVLLELGPGPMRLKPLKRRLFSQVYFFDIADFGVPDPALRIMDIEQCRDSGALLSTLPQLSPDDRIFVFGDHCLEHISIEMLTTFLASLLKNGFIACFRVPNVYSSKGLGSFQRDSTHRTSFDTDFRKRLEALGFSISPWIRWYRPLLASRVLLGRRQAMNHAEEIAISLSY